MFVFTLGAALMYALLLCATLIMEGAVLFPQPRLAAFVVLSTLVLPVLTTWGLLEAINLASPRRLLDRRVRRPLARLIGGVIAGSLGVCLATISLALLDWSIPDGALTAAGAALATVGVTLPLRRVRRNECIHCAYDLAGATVSAGGGICPECGEPTMPPTEPTAPPARGSRGAPAPGPRPAHFVPNAVSVPV